MFSMEMKEVAKGEPGLVRAKHRMTAMTAKLIQSPKLKTCLKAAKAKHAVCPRGHPIEKY